MSWLQILDAVACLLKEQHPAMLAAMDGRSSNDPSPQSIQAVEPTLYFYVLFGLAFEVLSTPTSPVVSKTTISALEGLVQPSVCGPALFMTGSFEELCSLAFRLALTEGAPVQIQLSQLFKTIVKLYPEPLNEVYELAE
jgi:HEAT repeat-containing protein 5